MVVLLHFVASWAAPICEPHRGQVSDAARSLGAEVVEVDIDADPDTAKAYKVPNVPAVAVLGAPNSVTVGALPSEKLIERLRPYLR